MAAEAIGVEERERQPITREPFPEAAQQVAVGGELQGQSLVLIEALRHELGQPDGMEQARRNPAGKGLSAAGQHRQT